MQNTDFANTCLLIRMANTVGKVQDVFGKLRRGRDSDLERINTRFTQLAKIVHPDKVAGQPVAKVAQAEVAFQCLVDLRDKAIELVQGKKVVSDSGMLAKPITFKAKRGTCTFDRLLARGSGVLIYAGVLQRGAASIPAYVRVPLSPSDNDLMEREAKAYAVMWATLKTTGPETQSYLAARLPMFDCSVKLTEPSKAVRQVNVFHQPPELDGWYNLTQIKAKHTAGLNLRQVAFIWNRMLEALTLTHTAGICHGNITEHHVWIHAATHKGQLIDWTCSGRTGEKPAYKGDGPTPPEWETERVLSYSSDLYMLAKLMLGLIRPTPGDLRIHARPVYDVLNQCLQPDPQRRINNVAALHTKLREALVSVFGPPAFVELPM